jgi:hypothetical protein
MRFYGVYAFCWGPGKTTLGSCREDRHHAGRRLRPERLAHDVAVVTFPAGSLAGVAPIKVAKTGLLDRLYKRQSFWLVGYGVDPERGDGAPVYIAEGYRQTRTTSAAGLTRRQLKLKAGLCFGDSGSPQFLGDTNVAVSVFSDHGGECAGPVRQPAPRHAL